MKKMLVLILLLTAAAGTFVPCCSIDDCCADQVAGNANHDKHNKEGACSPFFACATCPASVELTKAIQLDFPSAENLVHQQAIMKFGLPTYSPSFWQPPRSC